MVNNIPNSFKVKIVNHFNIFIHCQLSLRDENLFSYKSTFDQTNLNSALKTIHLTYPDLDGKLLRHYIVQRAKQKIIAFPVERSKIRFS